MTEFGNRKKVEVVKADNGYIIKVLSRGESVLREPYEGSLMVTKDSQNLFDQLSEFFDVPKINAYNTQESLLKEIVDALNSSIDFLYDIEVMEIAGIEAHTIENLRSVLRCALSAAEKIRE